MGRDAVVDSLMLHVRGGAPPSASLPLCLSASDFGLSTAPGVTSSNRPPRLRASPRSRHKWRLHAERQMSASLDGFPPGADHHVMASSCADVVMQPEPGDAVIVRMEGVAWIFSKDRTERVD